MSPGYGLRVACKRTGKGEAAVVALSLSFRLRAFLRSEHHLAADEPLQQPFWARRFVATVADLCSMNYSSEVSLIQRTEDGFDTCVSLLLRPECLACRCYANRSDEKRYNNA
jgi:hypothetical protein